MASQEVTCVKTDTQKRTIQIGGVGWRYTVAEAMPLIRADPQRFYTVNAATGGKAYLIVVAGSYLRTEPDTTKKDNLDSLPACP